MEIYQISFEHINGELFLVSYYTNGKVKKYKLNDKFRSKLFDLLCDIVILNNFYK